MQTTKFQLVNSLLTGAPIRLVSLRDNTRVSGVVLGMELESGGAARDCWNVVMSTGIGNRQTVFVRTID
jgi:hypothetical protein